MAEYCASHHLAIRPHTKTNEIPETAQQQLDLGTTGVTVAKVGVAEVMAAIGGKFDFSNVWTDQNAFNSGSTGNGSTFAFFHLGLPSGGNVPTNDTAFYSQHFWAGFIQDDWRLTSILSLNLGLLGAGDAGQGAFQPAHRPFRSHGKESGQRFGAGGLCKHSGYQRDELRRPAIDEDSSCVSLQCDGSAALPVSVERRAAQSMPTITSGSLALGLRIRWQRTQSFGAVSGDLCESPMLSAARTTFRARLL
jgi:hypothetical protein